MNLISIINIVINLRKKNKLDTEHKELFHIADEAYHLLKEEFVPDKFDHIVSIILELKEYAVKHFADEEEYMLSIRYKKFFEQKTEHEYNSRKYYTHNACLFYLFQILKCIRYNK